MEHSNFYNWFDTISSKLGVRKDSFYQIFKYLDDMPDPIIIVETGCLRIKDNFSGFDKLNVLRTIIPAVTHVDYSARIQTVNKKRNRIYYDLINKFKEKSGCPILVNTSFNVRGEPIVNTPLDAFNCFMGTELDKLVIGNFYLDKSKQNQNLKRDYSKEFELD